MPNDLRAPAKRARPNEALLTTRLSAESELEPHREAWCKLACGVPTRSPHWLLVWWHFYRREGDTLCVLLFHDEGGELVGLAPLYLGKGKTVRLLGSGAASTNHTTWLSAGGEEHTIGVAVSEFLLAARQEWNRIKFDSADADDPALNATVTHLAQHGCLVCSTPQHSCWRILLPPSWEEYLMTLSRIHRKRCRKLQQLLDTGRVQVHKVMGAADFSRGFDILLLLHGARWGAADQPLGCFSDTTFREFHRAAAQELLAHDQLLLVWLELDGKPIAVEYQFAGGGTIYSYQAGMDPSIVEFSPGSLSILASIRDSIAQGFVSFDLSRGDQPYKANWRATPAASYDLRIWPDRIGGRLEHGVWELRNQAEQERMRWVRRIKARVPKRFIERWRELVQALGGKRRSPRKVAPPR